MEKTLALLGSRYVQCLTTGESALIDQWVPRIAKLRGIDGRSVRARLRAALDGNGEAYGLQWKWCDAIAEPKGDFLPCGKCGAKPMGDKCNTIAKEARCISDRREGNKPCAKCGGSGEVSWQEDGVTVSRACGEC